MALSKPVAENVRRSRHPFCRSLVEALQCCTPLLGSCLVAGFCLSVVALKASAGFIPAPSYAAGSGPQSVAVGDFNCDDIPDLAVATANDGTVSVLLGNEDGSFQAAHNYAVDLGPQSLAVGDFNGDGHPDLVVANALSGTVSILVGNGDGIFQAAQGDAVGGE